MSFWQEIWGYLKERKKFWLLPMLIILIFMGIILAFSVATGLAPFIYPVF